MKYISDLFRISAFIFIIYVGFWIWNSHDLFIELNNSGYSKSVKKITDSKNTIEKFLIENRFLEACLQAGAEHRSGNVFTYFIDVPETPCWNDGGKEFIDSISNQLKPNVITEFKNEKQIKFFAVKLQTNNVDWILVNQRPDVATFSQRFKTSETFRSSIFKDIFAVLQIMLIIIFIFSIMLVEDLQGQLRKAGKKSHWLALANNVFGWVRPKYIKMAVTAQAAQIQQTDELTKQLEFISTSLQSTVLQEIKKNKSKIPYTFTGTVARVDINAFSTAVAAGNADQVTIITDVFLQLACELMQRYDGLFEKALGDEIIVVFKDDNENEKSSLRALAFARDLLAAYSKIGFEVADQKNKFTVKASLNKSPITFLLGPAGPVFSGDALTYTKRLLDAVTIKDRNIISSLSSGAAADYEKLVKLPEKSEQFHFKNMKSVDGYQFEKFLSAEMAYDQYPEYLKYFKSDQDICFLFEKILIEQNSDQLTLVFQCLRKIRVSVASQELIQAWIMAIQKYESKSQSPNFKIHYANLISAGLSLIPENQWTDECTNTVANVSRKTDGRMNAAIVELLANKKNMDIVANQSESFILNQDPSFRTEGNLLIAQAMMELNESVLMKIYEMLVSDNPLKLNTGIFVAGQVLDHYNQKNPAALRTFSNYKKIMKQIFVIQKSKNDLLSGRMQNVVVKLLNSESI